MHARRWAGVAAMLVLSVRPGAAQRPEFGAGALLFHYHPLALPGAVPYTEVYAAYATVGVVRGRWKSFAEVRARDDRLRPYFPGNVWLQQAWAGYDLLPDSAGSRLTLRAGKTYEVLGRFWDGSFFGNLQYFSGLKLNPQFGAEAVGRLPAGAANVEYTLQLVSNSDRVSGALAERSIEALPGWRERDSFNGRVAAALPAGFTLGAGAASRGAQLLRSEEIRGYRFPLAALDAAWAGGPFAVFAEWTRRGRGDLPPALTGTPAGSAATFWLLGAQATRGRVQGRYNYSRVHFVDLARTEWIHQPGVTVTLAPGFAALAEFDLWRAALPGGTATMDRSLDLVLSLTWP